jgi:hypothetical protein
LVRDEELFIEFRDDVDGKYAPARVEDVGALIESFGRYATREYDREFVAANTLAAIKATCDVTPEVHSQILTPYQTIGVMNGDKASGYLALGNKYNFHQKYMSEMQEALQDPSSLMECVPIYVVIPKVEIRAVEKMPRDLAYPPAWFVDLVAMFEKDFFSVTMEQWHVSPIKVGMPMPAGWPMIVHGLKRHDVPEFQSIRVDWDAVQYDRSHPIEVTISWHILMELKKCFEGLRDDQDLDSPLRRVLAYINFWSCVRIVLLPDGRLVLVAAGIYSGDISTTNKNSYFHIVRIALVWIKIHGTVDGFRTWLRKSGIVIFGDDGTCSINRKIYLRLLEGLATTWKDLFGAELKVHQSHYLSEVVFLGRRALGDDAISQLLPVTSDLDRQISSLVEKTRKGMTPVQRLSKLVAHRLLLSGFSLNPALASPATAEKNARGARSLKKLDSVIAKHIDREDERNADLPDWVSLTYLAHMPASELFYMQLTGKEVIRPEAYWFPVSAPEGVGFDSMYEIDPGASGIVPYGLCSAERVPMGNGLRAAPLQSRLINWAIKFLMSGKMKKGAAPKKVKSMVKKIERIEKKVVKDAVRSRAEMKVGGKGYKINQPAKIGKKASAAGAGTLAWAMSLCHPGDPKYNQAKMPSPIPLKTVIANTAEPLYAGTPSTVSINDGVVPQTLSGFGGFVMRPNTLGRQYGITTGSQILGFDPDGEANPGLVAYCPADSSNQALILNFMDNNEIPAPVTDPTQAAWLSPLAMEEIQKLGVAYRVTSAEATATYTGPPISGSGLIASGAVKYDQLQNIECETSTTNTELQVGLEWDYFVGLESVFQGPAMEGCSVKYIPNDTRCMDWKETVMFFQNYNTLHSAAKRTGVSKTAIRSGLKSGKLEKIVKKSADLLRLQKDKKIALTMQKDLKTGVSRATGINFPSTDTPRPRDVSTIFPNMTFFGASGTDNGFVPQPEDTPAGFARAWIEALSGAYALSAPPSPLLPSDLDDLLSMYSDNSWDGAEDLMVIMWNGVAPASAIAGSNPLESIFAGNLFEIQKYVNYELVIDLNSLSLGQVIPTGGNQGNPVAAISLAQASVPVASSLAPAPVKSSGYQTAATTLNNISGAVKSTTSTVDKVVETGSKAAAIAMDIGEALAAFF